MANLFVILEIHGLTEEEIKGFIHDYVTAAQNGISAGADGIEIAAGYGFLVNQFLDPVTNHRTDKYGGSIENRSRFLLEIIDTVGEAIGAENLAVRLSPWNKHGGMSGNNDPSNIAQYSYLIGELEKRAKAGKRLAFVDVVEGIDEGKYYPGSTNHKNLSNNDFVRSIWDGIILRSGELGANPELVKEFIQDERTLIGYGRAYIANPDLVVRLEQGLPLNAANVSTFYSGGKEGYLDYPTYSESLKLKWDKV